MNDTTEMQSGFQNFLIEDVDQSMINDAIGVAYFADSNNENYNQTEDNRPITPLQSRINCKEINEEIELITATEDNLDELFLNLENPYQKLLVVSPNGNKREYVLVKSNPDETASEEQIHENVSSTSENFENGDFTSENMDLQGEIIYRCSCCNYSSRNKYLVTRHAKIHSNERPYKCSVCVKSFKTKASLQNHENIHTGSKPYGCQECNARFNSSCEVVRHVKYIHTHEKAHKCKICDYASVELSKLRRHMRIHTGERPYKCTDCDYASPDRFKLKRHFRVHTGEKPYQCNICEASFTQSNSLKAHMLTHNIGNRKTFQCEYCPATHSRKSDHRFHVLRLHTLNEILKCKCGQTFHDRYSYKLHRKTHQGQKCYQCLLCPYAAISEKLLKTHILIHTDEKPYECILCNKRFRQNQLLKRHHNIHHNPNYVPPSSGEKKHKCPECGQSFKHVGNLIRHSVKHDPNSGFEEQKRALKLGRQTKVQITQYQKGEFQTDLCEFVEQNKDVVLLKPFFVNNNEYSIRTNPQLPNFTFL